ncbi:MAG: hypothetical protein ACLURV_10320 [Gallintestinimicrobium sp.]
MRIQDVDPLGLATDLTLSWADIRCVPGETPLQSPDDPYAAAGGKDSSYEKFCEYTKMVDKEETGYLRGRWT